MHERQQKLFHQLCIKLWIFLSSFFVCISAVFHRTFSAWYGSEQNNLFFGRREKTSSCRNLIMESDDGIFDCTILQLIWFKSSFIVVDGAVRIFSDFAFYLRAGKSRRKILRKYISDSHLKIASRRPAARSIMLFVCLYPIFISLHAFQLDIYHVIWLITIFFSMLLLLLFSGG